MRYFSDVDNVKIRLHLETPCDLLATTSQQHSHQAVARRISYERRKTIAIHDHVPEMPCLKT